MDDHSRDNRMLLMGLAFSIGVHVLVLLPWLNEEASASGDRSIADLAHPLAPPPPEDQVEEAELGIDESLIQSMNWIGYKDYEEHLARLAETEQAAFKVAPSAGGGAPPSSPQTSTAVPTPDDSRPSAAAPTITAPSTRKPNEPKAPAAERPNETDEVRPVASEEVEPKADSEAMGPPRPEPTPENADPSSSPESETTPKTEPKPEPRPATEPSPTPKPEPEPGEGPGSGEGEPADAGDAAEKESDPTSTVEVPPENWRAGRPLAAHGLEIRTRRPVLTELTLLTVRYGNPLVKISFGSNGRPRTAVILESSGDRRVDEPILDSLFRWRAKGERLRQLEDGETADITLRIMMR